jgi:hypothetical protein
LLGAALACTLASAHADEVRVGRYRLILPDGLAVAGQSFDAGRTGSSGEVGLSMDGRLLRLSSPANDAVALVVLRTIHGQGNFQWFESCRNVKTDDRTFVHSPFDVLRDECLVVAGPVDLDGSLRASVPACGAVMDRAGWALKSGGYFVSATFSLSSGEMLDVIALVPAPFAGVPATAPLPANRSRVPNEIVAWGVALIEQVKAGVLSLSGQWHLPPIVRPNDGKTQTASAASNLTEVTTP